MKKVRLFIGLLSVIIASLFLIYDLYSYFLQQKYPILWQFPVILKTSLSSWMVFLILFFAGGLLLFKKGQSQYTYGLFGLCAIIEVYTILIYHSRLMSFFDDFLILLPFLSIGIFSLVLVTSAKWKNRLGWDNKISLNLWVVFLIISLLISGFPRFFIDYPSYDLTGFL
jgi:hypothetical protein